MNALTGRIRLDFRSEEPLTMQMAQQIKQLIDDGVLKPGEQLPTVRELAIDLRINFSTVARVYRILDEEKLISTQRGRGTYIWDNQERQAGLVEQPMQASTAERGEQASRLAKRFIEECLQQGMTLAEIEQAFMQEISR